MASLSRVRVARSARRLDSTPCPHPERFGACDESRKSKFEAFDCKLPMSLATTEVQGKGETKQSDEACKTYCGMDCGGHRDCYINLEAGQCICKVKSGVIIGIVGGVVALIALCICGCCMALRSQRKNSRSAEMAAR